VPSSLTTEQVLALLAEAPTRIAALTAGVSPAQLRHAPTRDEWSANEVLAHLRSCADVWGSCIATIIAEDRPTIRAINPRTGSRARTSPTSSLGVALDASTNERSTEDGDLSAPSASTRVLLVRAREDLEVARATRRIIAPAS